MIEHTAKLVDTLSKIPTSLVVALFIASSALLFLPDKFAATLSIDTFRDDYRSWIGPTWLLLFAILGTKVVLTASANISGHMLRKQRQRYLHELTLEEKGYLCQFIQDGLNTIYVDMSDGVAGGLLRKQIVYRASDVFDVLEGVPYNLQPWARDYLTKHPEALDGAQGRPITPRERRGLNW